MNSFRLSNKKIYNDSRSSIEDLHNEKMKTIMNKNNTLSIKKNKLTTLLEKKNLILNSQKQNMKNKLRSLIRGN